MTWFTGLVVYALTWWVTLFAVLPWGNRTPDNPETGTADGAPDRPRLGYKFLMTTLISALVWLAIYGLVASDIVSFRDIARQMPM